jgi:hypothetical protein
VTEDDKDWWARISASAALVHGKPAWTGAGVLDHNGVMSAAVPNVPWQPADRLYTRSECDALVEAERARMLATLPGEVQAVLEVFANASPDDTCGSLTARTESCSYWAQELAKKLVRP